MKYFVFSFTDHPAFLMATRVQGSVKNGDGCSEDQTVLRTCHNTAVPLT